MPGRMAKRIHRTDARRQLDVAVERLKVLGVPVRLEDRHRLLKPAFLGGRRRVHLRLAQPVIRLLPGHVHERVGEHRPAVLREATDMVGVHVRYIDVIHLLRLIAGGGQVGEQLADRRTEGAAGAGVDQLELRAGVDEKTVDGELDRLFEKSAREIAIQLGGGDVRQQALKVERQNAVAEHSHLEVPEQRAIEARRLGLL